MDEILATTRWMQPYVIGIVFVLVYLAEHLVPQRKDLQDYRHDLYNLLIGAGNVVVVAVGGYYLQRWLGWIGRQHFGLLHFLPIGKWTAVIAGIFLVDLFMYWWHRLNHVLPLLWYFHRFHHKDEKLNSTSALRFHIGELFFSYIAKALIYPLLGLGVGAVAIHGLLMFPIVLFHHSNVRIPETMDHFFRLIFVSPLMHRIHHSVIQEETDSNYSSLLPYWDKLFGSYRHKPLKPICFGL